MLEIVSFTLGPAQTNAYLVADSETKEAAVIDPSWDGHIILEAAQKRGWRIAHLWYTHAHFDHFLASGAMKEATGAVLCLHQDDLDLWRNLDVQCRMFGVPSGAVPMPDYWLRDEEKILLGDIPVVALHTPGHTPG